MRDKETIKQMMEQFAGNDEEFRTQKYILEVLLDIRELLQKANDSPQIKVKISEAQEPSIMVSQRPQPSSMREFPPFDKVKGV